MNISQNKPLLMRDNPFFHRGPIRDRRYFYGRAKETSQALQMLRNGQCVSIVGPRRIGKTSLLFHLRELELQQGYSLGDEYLLVYIDCQSMGDLAKTQFYRQLWQETKGALTERGKAEGWPASISDFSEFRETMITIREKGYKPTFLFDEFETIVKNPNLDQNLFSDLRSLVPYTIYATASQDSLYDLTFTDRSILSSPFFNIFKEVPSGFLRPKEAEEMVRGLVRMTGQEDIFSEKDLAFVFEAGGYHPFFLQLVCYHLFEYKMKCKDLTEADYTSVQREYTEDAEPHFHYAWTNLNADDQKAAQLVYEGSGSQLDHRQKRQLERKCILYGDAFFSSVFAEFVRRQTDESGVGKAWTSNQVNVASEGGVLGQKHLTILADILGTRFDREELRTLCFSLGVDYDDLPAEGKSNKARELVKRLQRHDRIPELIEIGKQLRRDISWIEVLEADEGASPTFQSSPLGHIQARHMKSKKALRWLRKVVATLVVALFVVSAILAGPDLPDLAMRVLHFENVTPLYVQGTTGEVLVKVYSPKLLFIGETALIEMQTYSPEKPEFNVTANPSSSDVVITEKEGTFEIKCKGTNASMLSRSVPIELEVEATISGRSSATTAVTVKSNYLLYLLSRVGILLSSGGLSVKKLREWLQATGEGKTNSAQC